MPAFEAGAAQPVTVDTTGGKRLAGAAIPVYVAAGGPQIAGPARRVVVVTDGPIEGRAAVPVYEVASGGALIDGPAVPVYVVQGSLGEVATVPLALLTSLISYWKLDEASGARADSVGSNTLTDNNTVTQAAGKIGSAGQFTKANSEYLSRADNASLSTGDIDFSVAAWVYLDSKPAAAMGIVTKDGGGANREYVLQWNNVTDRFEMRLFDMSGNSIGIATANNFGAPSLATWYLVIGWHDSVNNQVGIAVNAGAANTTATTGVPADENATFYIGADQGVLHWDGRIDEVGFWKKVLTSAERTGLYNGGAGRTYPFAGT